MIVGVQVPRIVLIVIPLVVVGWSIYHYVVVDLPVGVKPPGASDDHEELAGLVLIGYEEDRTPSGAGRDAAGGREAVARAYLRIRQDGGACRITAERSIWGIRGSEFGLR